MNGVFFNLSLVSLLVDGLWKHHLLQNSKKPWPHGGRGAWWPHLKAWSLLWKKHERPIVIYVFGHAKKSSQLSGLFILWLLTKNNTEIGWLQQFGWLGTSRTSFDSKNTPNIDGSEIPNNHRGCTKPCKYWDSLPINWLVGFLPSTVLQSDKANPQRTPMKGESCGETAFAAETVLGLAVHGPATFGDGSAGRGTSAAERGTGGATHPGGSLDCGSFRVYLSVHKFWRVSSMMIPKDPFLGSWEKFVFLFLWRLLMGFS